ncbi:MAG: CDP-diacylglycerol--glycerol-3-phosphate 3-phosphatidyltransferase [Syntrophobacterales bacterium]|nr:CDP-diacylglycerol--glycerol-3-phosphate 3-phosphatidyltransferase [Syntrophobacterales bacterium]
MIKRGGRRDFLNIPNILTYFRIAAVPVVLVALNPPVTPTAFHIAFFTCLAALITDYLDGILARRKHMETPIGKLLDPLADKLLVLAVFIMLIPLKKIASWIVFLVVGRELIITGLRSIAASQGIILKASLLGKNKMISQSLAMLCFVAFVPSFQRVLDILGNLFLWISLILGYISAGFYFVQFLNQMRRF